VSLQPATLKLAGGLGALLVCGGAGAAVAADQRPDGAPLRPAVSHGTAPVAEAASGGLLIPPTPVCSGPAGARPPVAAAAAPRATDPQLAAVLQQLAQAPTAAARRQLLAGLTADQRQQVTALMRQRAAAAAAAKRGAAGARAGGGVSCLGGGGSGGGRGAGQAITPSVTDGGSSGPPITFTYVS
jgi:uncharacterized membrane protein YgcG